jgi:hypothetical protein
VIVLFFGSVASSAQVGIGTKDIGLGLLLEVRDPLNQSGALLPQADIPDLNTVSPLPTGTEVGTLIYNTNISSGIGYYFWDGSSWDRSTAYVGQMVKYSNPATAVTGRNLNSRTTAELVGNLEFNDNSSLYVSSSNDGITISETGVYTVTVALSLVGTYGTSGSDGQRERAEIDARILVSGSVRGPLYRSTEMNMTSAPGDKSFGSLSFTQSVKVNAGQTITIRTDNSTNNSLGIVRLRSTGTSTIFIQKIL